MAVPAKPPTKKIKTEDSVFETFWNHKTSLRIFKEQLESLKTKDYCFCLLKIKHCNACEGYSFSNAYCATEQNVISKDGETFLDAYSISTVFMQGYSTLMSYVDEMIVPKRNEEKVMLEKLLKVFMDLNSIQDALKKIRSKNDVDWTIALTHHLLKKLSVSETYVIDNHYSRCNNQCSCCQQRITGVFGDTSIGNTAVWHGYVDIILGTGVPIAAGDTYSWSNNIDSEEGNECEFGIKSSMEFPEKARGQLIAQTIVFSFLQKKDKDYDNYLIPSIGISKSQVSMFLYDCENDILLEGKPFQLWIDPGNVVDRAGVIALWLAINYSLTCSGVTDHMKKSGFTAEFYKQVGNELKTYKEYVQFGCGPGIEVKKHFEPRAYSHLDLH